jgi:hypothetical protein
MAVGFTLASSLADLETMPEVVAYWLAIGVIAIITSMITGAGMLVLVDGRHFLN